MLGDVHARAMTVSQSAPARPQPPVTRPARPRFAAMRPSARRCALAGLLPIVGALALAAAIDGRAGEGSSMTFSIASSAFAANAAIPALYTCEGRDISPPLAWGGVPAGARSLALVVDDPDAPDPAAPQTTWVHWLLYDIPAKATALAEGIGPDALPQGTREGMNDFGRTGYGGPCPPIGRHRYFFKLYALDIALPDLRRPTKAVLERAMRGHVVAQATLVGTYQARK
jgi:Raf kinase inhibitor-like YbhB/YbcL family protein